MSASSNPTLRWSFDKAIAIFAVSVDFPTPPFQEPIAIILFTPAGFIFFV